MPWDALRRAVEPAGSVALAALADMGFAVVVLKDGRIAYANEQAARQAGTTVDAMVGQASTAFIAADEKAWIDDQIRSTPPTGSAGTIAFTTSEGRRVHAEYWTSVRKDGALVAVYRDVTARLEAETARRLGEKVDAVAKLVSGVAHDVNNPLSVLRCNNAILRERLGGLPDEDASRVGRLLDANERALRRVAAQIRRLQVLAAPQAGRRAPTDLAPLLEGVAEDVRRYAPACRLDVDLAPLPAVTCDGEVVADAVRGLLVNGIEASPSGRVLLAARRDGGTVEILVEDDGPGFTEEAYARRFEPFFTTKPQGNVGIGLTLARLVAADHGGALEVDAPSTGGARLRMRLPVGGS